VALAEEEGFVRSQPTDSTTDNRSPHLSPHLFRCGLYESEEGTPLVGLAFRLEVEALLQNAAGEDEAPDKPDPAAAVVEIFEKLPTLRAELHYVGPSAAREWLASPEAEQQPHIFRKYDHWQVKAVDEPGSDTARFPGPNDNSSCPPAYCGTGLLACPRARGALRARTGQEAYPTSN
jgi:hypothetical protein